MNKKQLVKIEKVWKLIEDLHNELWDDFKYFIETLEKYIHNNYK
jgi:hypothetical protein